MWATSTTPERRVPRLQLRTKGDAHKEIRRPIELRGSTICTRIPAANKTVTSVQLLPLNSARPVTPAAQHRRRPSQTYCVAAEKEEIFVT